MYVEVCGLGPSAALPTGGWEHAQVTVERDGRISATTGASPHGQGNETTFAQMLADQFGVPLEHVTILLASATKPSGSRRTIRFPSAAISRWSKSIAKPGS